MFRLLVGALAAFVGFSFGQAVPKWIENRSKKVAPATQKPRVPEQQAPARRILLRRKPFRRFKFASTRSGREALLMETHAELDTHAEVGMDGKPREGTNPGMHVQKEDLFSIDGPESTSGTEDDSTGAAAQSSWKSRSSVERSANFDQTEAPFGNPLLKHNASTPEDAKGRQKLQEWKSKLKRLKNKALANEKIWCDKYEEPTKEQHFKVERVFNRRPDWEHKSCRKLLTNETEFEQDMEKARRLLEEERSKTSLHSGTELFIKERRKEETAKLDVRYALLDGRKADLER